MIISVTIFTVVTALVSFKVGYETAMKDATKALDEALKGYGGE